MRREILSLFAGVGLCLTAGAAAWAGPLIGKPHAPELVVPIWSLTGECYPIDFTGVDIEWYAGRSVYQLTVTGVKPYMNMDVSLSHEAIAAVQPIGARWSSAASRMASCCGLRHPITSP